jgi:electron transfer flavoprotein alpha subunit
MAGACSLQKPLAAPLLVVVELPDGELSETGKGTLAKGGMLSQLLGGKWSVASFAPPDPKVFDGFTPYGVPDLTVIDAPPAVSDSMPAQGKLIAQAARNTGAKVIMLPHNDLGSSLAPLLACELNAAIYTEVIGFDVCEAGLKLMNVTLGVTRPVYDFGWAGFERMVGQTGKAIAPRFYLGIGISGSMHHVGGIKDSRKIVAMNIDSKAPMFANSDEAIVADLKEVLPRLIKRVRAITGGA